VPIVLLTLLGAALRFYAIGRQGFWLDESYSDYLVRQTPGHMLGLIPHLESTPPFYYCVAWVWTRIFGFGPAGLKSLSALCGTLTVPVAYATARKLLPSPRAALILAALAACNPMLIWYSQEARAYAMLVLFAATTVLAFAYVRERPRRMAVAYWVLACVIALITHYYALIVVAPEAAWLLYEHRRSRAVQLGIGVIILAGLALLPLALQQLSTRNNHWIARASYLMRLRQIPALFLIGPETHARTLLKFLAFAIVILSAALLVWRSRRLERRSALLPGGLALAGLLIAAVPGHSTLLGRNVLPLWLPAAAVVASGLGAARARLVGAVGTLLLCAIGITAVISVDTDYRFQRPNWAPVARILGPWPAPGQSARDGRIVIVQDNPSVLPLSLYLPHLHYLTEPVAQRVTEIDVIAALPHRHLGGFCWWGSECNLVPSRLKRDYRIPGFRIAGRARVHDFAILRLRSTRPLSVAATELPEPGRHEAREFLPRRHPPLHDAHLIEQS
jgi:mannosyltransferase